MQDLRHSLANLTALMSMSASGVGYELIEEASTAPLVAAVALGSVVLLLFCFFCRACCCGSGGAAQRAAHPQTRRPLPTWPHNDVEVGRARARRQKSAEYECVAPQPRRPLSSKQSGGAQRAKPRGTRAA